MDEAGRPRAVFELRDVTLATPVPEVLGLWVTVPAVSTGLVGGIAFDASPGALAEAAVWRVNLAGDLSQAAGLLATGEARLAASQQALAVATDRLTELVRLHSGSLAFNVSGAGPALTRPEIDLLAFVQEMRDGQPSVSFGLGDQLIGGWKEAAEQFQVLISRLRQVVSSYALTTPGGILLALPAAWKFINQVMAELDKHRERMEAAGG